MVHIEFLISIITLLSGFISLTFLFFLYFKFNKSLFKYVIIFLSPFHISLIFYLMEVYLRNIKPEMNLYAYVTIWTAIVVAYGFSIIPYAIYKIIEKPFSIKNYSIFIILSFLRIMQAVLILGYNMEGLNFIGNIIEIMLTGYIILILRIYKKKIKIIELGRFFRNFSLLTVLLILFLILDYIFYSINIKAYAIFLVLTPLHLYFFICNLLIIKAIFSYFIIRKSINDDEISKEFIDLYGISNREVEVIQLLIHGYTAREMGELLYISRQTVKNHIYKIYQKVNVNNKIEFLNQLKSIRLDIQK